MKQIAPRVSPRPSNRVINNAAEQLPVREVALESVANRFANLLSGAQELGQRLVIVADRQFGGEAKEDGASGAPTAPGAIGRLHNIASDFEAQLRVLHAQVERLEQL